MKNTRPTSGRGVSERDFEKWVIDVARALGWKCWHFHDSRRQVAPGVFVGDKDATGMCDWILTHNDPPRLVFAELKGANGKLTDAQQECLQALKTVADLAIDKDDYVAHGEPSELPVVGVYVWTPGMENQIETLLRTRILTR